ncbi:MAG: substrate-binding domain-containing protein [Pirellulales bacterium]|nr:substrate-binding domain-containing protein [Pirellulales bacterium]
MVSAPKHKQVALAFPVGVPWLALCMRGIAEYAQEHGGWNFLSSLVTLIGAKEFSITVSGLRGWPGDGVIAFINDLAEARAAKRLGIPVVALSGMIGNVELPRVMVDHYAIGRLGAEHLLQCGFRRLGFYGIRGPWYSRQRCRGFRDRAAEAGVPCSVFDQLPATDSRMSWQKRVAPVDQWLQTLKPPVGIMAVHDFRARILLEECNRLGLDVPHQVALIGADNDPTICENCQPTLSSVMRNAWQIGYAAAALLDKLISGKTPRQTEIVFPPEGVAQRRSTDTIAVDDPQVSAAVHLMHDHLAEVVGIESILAQVPVSRRFLEKRFQNLFGCTPYQYLCRLRIERAKQLLRNGERIKLRSLAKTCGFTNSDHMRLVFHRTTGLTPGEYRRKHASRKRPASGQKKGRHKIESDVPAQGIWKTRSTGRKKTPAVK